MINPDNKVILTSLLLLLNGCITQFVPKTNEDKELLVVEGLITDQPGANTIKLSKSLPLGTSNIPNPAAGCVVTISDDLENTYNLKEVVAGTYVTDPTLFQGVVGRQYTLHIRTNAAYYNHNFESAPVEMKPVPPIDSLYYEKRTIQEGPENIPSQEGCQVFLNTHDPTNRCKFYRWKYSETWEFILPYLVTNRICWISDNSNIINIKNTSIIEDDKIDRYPINFISNQTDRLKVKYSILVNQYSLNEDEYNYWAKLQSFSEQIGGLYDMIPSAVPSNVFCIDDPKQEVLGYFSVSASSSKRIFIKDHFAGLIDLYTACIADTVFGGGAIPFLNSNVWVIITVPLPPPGYRVTTYTKGCADCTVRGTLTEPDFWNDDK
ncbi:MAG: DUF4249 domain-containing protein [Bacteroidales bacterium]